MQVSPLTDLTRDLTSFSSKGLTPAIPFLTGSTARMRNFLHPCDTFAVSLKVRDDGAKAHVSWQDADGNWLWGLGSTWIPFAQPDADGWRAGEVFVEAPMGARRLAIGLSAGSPEGGVVPVDALHVWKFR